MPNLARLGVWQNHVKKAKFGLREKRVEKKTLEKRRTRQISTTKKEIFVKMSKPEQFCNRNVQNERKNEIYNMVSI